MDRVLGRKAMDILRMAALPVASAEFEEEWRRLDDLYSAKAVVRKVEQLAGKGLVEYGVSAAYPWLTPEGAALLERQG